MKMREFVCGTGATSIAKIKWPIQTPGMNCRRFLGCRARSCATSGRRCIARFGIIEKCITLVWSPVLCYVIRVRSYAVFVVCLGVWIELRYATKKARGTTGKSTPNTSEYSISRPGSNGHSMCRPDSTYTRSGVISSGNENARTVSTGSR